MEATRTASSRFKPWRLAIGGLALAAVVAAAVVVVSAKDSDRASVSSPSIGKSAVPAQGPRQGELFSSGLPNGKVPPYLETWRVPSVASAVAQAHFHVVLPNVPSANPGNASEQFVFPNGSAVAFIYPLPSENQGAGVRQAYIEVYESPWTGGDPLADYKNDMALDPVEGKQIIQLGSTPALAVSASSPSDATGENPAFVRFVSRDGAVEYQVSGGNNLGVLRAIAMSILNQAQ